MIQFLVECNDMSKCHRFSSLKPPTPTAGKIKNKAIQTHFKEKKTSLSLWSDKTNNSCMCFKCLWFDRKQKKVPKACMKIISSVFVNIKTKKKPVQCPFDKRCRAVSQIHTENLDGSLFKLVFIRYLDNWGGREMLLCLESPPPQKSLKRVL